MPRRHAEQCIARFESGTFEQIDAMLGQDESRIDLIRAAVNREIKRRLRNPKLRHAGGLRLVRSNGRPA